MSGLQEDLHSDCAMPKSPEFNYSSVPELEDDLRTTASLIRENYTKTVIEVGKELQRVKELLGHGLFLDWVRAEFGFSVRLAENMMAAAKFAAANSQLIANLMPTAIYALAAKSTPHDALQAVVARLEAGETVSPRTVKEVIRQATGKEPAPKAVQPVQPATADPKPTSVQPASPVVVERQVENCNTAPRPTSLPQSDEFSEDTARELISLLVAAVEGLSDIPGEDVIQGLLTSCGLQYLADRLAKRSRITTERTYAAANGDAARTSVFEPKPQVPSHR
jgi:hypothetical protein